MHHRRTISLALSVLALAFLSPTLALRARQGEWRIYTPGNSSLTVTSFTAIGADSAGNVYVGGHYAGLDRFDGSSWHHELNTIWMMAIAPDRAGAAWAFGNGDLMRRGSGDWSVVSGGFNEVFYLGFDSRGYATTVFEPGVSTATTDKVIVGRFDGNEWNGIEFPIAGGVTSMAIDKEDVVWVGTRGTGIFRAGALDYTHLTSANSGLPSDTVTALATAPDGTIWIGTDQGLLRYRDNQWESVAGDALPDPYVRALAIERGGAVWALTGRWGQTPSPAGLARFENLTRTHLVIPPFPANRINVMTVDGTGDLWVTKTGDGENGVARYHGAAASVTTEARPASFTVAAAPNPSAGRTDITLDLDERADVTVEIFDARGSRVARLLEIVLGPGSHVVSWDGIDTEGMAVPGGLYFCRIRAGRKESTVPLVRQ